MNQKQAFYEELASFYHLIFEDWDKSIHQQGEVLSKLLPSPVLTGPILDCACGIGTQSFALARLGYQVEASDLSLAEIERAKKEAIQKGLRVHFRVDDMRLLSTSPLSHYGAVMAMDNALPHLDSDEEIMQALMAMRNRLRNGGSLLLSIRDYEKILQERPRITQPHFFMDGKYRRIVHQVWDWIDERRYIVHLYITCENACGWQAHHFTGQYRAVTGNEILLLMKKAGFKEVKIFNSYETKYHQPIIIGKLNL
jgi:2-polyprenyl-3-methyl-5-hydroxy-6-metoxy-1,4-benzoquinol methylase